MMLIDFLDKYLIRKRPVVYELRIDGRDALDVFVSEKIREERIRFMRRMLEIGLINFSGLTPREQKVMTVRFIEGVSLEETGQEFGVTRERIRQLEIKALEKLKSAN